MEIVLALVIGFGGGWWVHTPSKLDCRNEALVVTSCPPLTAQTDPTFGGTILKLQEVGGQYRECRAACTPVEVKK